MNKTRSSGESKKCFINHHGKKFYCTDCGAKLIPVEADEFCVYCGQKVTPYKYVCKNKKLFKCRGMFVSCPDGELSSEAKHSKPAWLLEWGERFGYRFSQEQIEFLATEINHAKEEARREVGWGS